MATSARDDLERRLKALREGIKRVPLPAFVARTALFRVQQLKDEGRVRCERNVSDALAAQLEGASARIADAIWARVEPIIGERLRPTPMSRSG